MAYLGEAGQLNDVTQEAVEAVGKAGGGPVPAGWYRVALVEDKAQAKDWGTGLSMQFQILGGDYDGRRVFDYLCVRHSTSEKAEEIARAKLKAFAISAGAKDPNNVTNTEPYYNKPVMMEVRREKEDEKYADDDGKKAKPADFMSCAEYKALNSGTPASAPTNSPGAEPSAPPADDDIPF